MSFAIPSADDHDDLRSAVRGLGFGLSAEYWRKVDEASDCPEDFVDALTTTDTDTTTVKTTAVRKGDRYVVSGRKVWISRLGMPRSC